MPPTIRQHGSGPLACSEQAGERSGTSTAHEMNPLPLDLERFKDLIYATYIRQNRTLKDTLFMLGQEYNFHPS